MNKKFFAESRLLIAMKYMKYAERGNIVFCVVLYSFVEVKYERVERVHSHGEGD